jgi:benzoate/toluate 1,2-dioxygenase reductase subunit
MEQGLPWLSGERFGEMDRWIDANRSFHECMVALADSDALLHAYRRLALPAMIARGLSSDDHIDPQLADDHREIVEAYERGDRDAAVAVVERHHDRALAMHQTGLLAAGGAI